MSDPGPTGTRAEGGRVSPLRNALKLILAAVGVLVLLASSCATCILLSAYKANERARADRDTLRPGMSCQAFFAAARAWDWAAGTFPPEATDRPAVRRLSISQYNDGTVSVTIYPDDSSQQHYPTYDAFLSSLTQGKWACDSCTSWSLTYRHGFVPAKTFLDVRFEGGKIAKIGQLAEGD